MNESQLENITVQFHGSDILWCVYRVEGKTGTHLYPCRVNSVLLRCLLELTFNSSLRVQTCASLSTLVNSNAHACVVSQSCLTFCDPMDCSPPGSSVHGVLQARILEWIVIAFLQGIFLNQGPNLHLWHFLHCQADFLPLAPPGKPQL